MKFKVIDTKTGKEPTRRVIDTIAKEYGLMEMDIDQFFVGEDGSIVLADDCCHIAYCDNERFKAVAFESSTESTESSTAKVYVVTQDGYLNGYGSEIYLVGVFTVKKDAEKAASAERACITEIQLNKTFPLEKSNWGGVGNDFYLGGYFE